MKVISRSNITDWECYGSTERSLSGLQAVGCHLFHWILDCDEHGDSTPNQIFLSPPLSLFFSFLIERRTLLSAAVEMEIRALRVRVHDLVSDNKRDE